MIFDWLQQQDLVLANSILALYLLGIIAASAVILVKAGRSPAWALGLLVPIVQIVIVCLFAVVRWPFVDGERER